MPEVWSAQPLASSKSWHAKDAPSFYCGSMQTVVSMVCCRENADFQWRCRGGSSDSCRLWIFWACAAVAFARAALGVTATTVGYYLVRLCPLRVVSHIDGRVQIANRRWRQGVPELLPWPPSASALASLNIEPHVTSSLTCHARGLAPPPPPPTRCPVSLVGHVGSGCSWELFIRASNFVL